MKNTKVIKNRLSYTIAMLLIGASTQLTGCVTSTNVSSPSNITPIIFGSFYGRCQGESCIETFKLTNDGLYEDKTDDYSHQSFNFKALSPTDFNKTKVLFNKLPSGTLNALLKQPDGKIGCPDCADGGGIFIQYKQNGVTRSWSIDNNLSSVPQELHVLVRTSQEAIDKINNKNPIRIL